jgi:hypothetical protein
MSNPKNILIAFALILTTSSSAANNNFYFYETIPPVEKKTFHNINSNPLSTYSPLWNTIKFNNLNTAKDAVYLTQEEKEVIWILNQVRYSPQLFLNTVLLNPKSNYYIAPTKRNYYYSSLIGDLKNAKSISVALFPDEKAFESAKCHAIESGKVGYVGHDRLSNCQQNFYGECCHYGDSDPMEIVLALLIDNNVPSLGHRKICLSPQYLTVGVSIQPHTTYRFNAVLDFLY